MTTATTAARRLRIDAIRDAATVRQAIGIRAIHHRLDDGRHQITVDGNTTVAPTVVEAIQAAREQRP
jgi:hypothetical protein